MNVFMSETESIKMYDAAVEGFTFQMEFKRETEKNKQIDTCVKAAQTKPTFMCTFLKGEGRMKAVNSFICHFLPLRCR